MKKLRLLSLAALGVASIGALAGCRGGSGEAAAPKKRTLTDVKVGLICLHDNSSTYDKNFIDSINNAVANAGLAESQLIVKTNVEEGPACGEAANELVEAGCDLVIADSFGHEPYMLAAAQANHNVEFFHCTGTRAHTAGLSNFHNGFASIYEGRFLAGVAAGLKLQEMKQADPTTPSKVGYVGAFTYAEVISGYTSWYLGVKSVVPDVTMEVQFTGSWYEPTAEKEAALNLIERGAVLLSQHADSMGAPNACEEKNVPDVSYNGSTYAACPNTFVVSSKIDWTFIFESLIANIAERKNSQVPSGNIASDVTGNILDTSVQLTEVGSAAAARTQTYLDITRYALLSGVLNVFDTSKFTVNDNWAEMSSHAAKDAEGHLTSYIADVDFDDDYIPDTEVISEGVFQESLYRSAPYFDVLIDGITLLNRKY